jgi:hypothetical protein
MVLLQGWIDGSKKRKEKKLKIDGSKVARTKVLVFFLVLWFCGQGFKTTCKEFGHEFKKIYLSCIHPPTKKNQDLFILQPHVNHVILCRTIHFNTHKVGRGCLPPLINFASVSVQF